MSQAIATIILFLLYINPSRLIIQRWFSGESSWKKGTLFCMIATTLIPLIVFYANYFLKIPTNQKTLTLILIGINALFLMIGSRKNPAQKNKNNEPILNLKYWQLLILGVLVLGYPYLFNKQPLIGGDSPHYLYNSTLLIKNETPPIIFDRNIVYFLPAIGEMLFGISVENMLKGIVLGFEIVFVFTSLFIAKKYVSARTLIPLGITLIFSLALYNLSKFIIPYFMALTICFAIIDLLQNKKTQAHWYLIFYLWGVLFNLHGVIAFASLGILIPLITASILKEKASFKQVLIGVVIFWISAQPLITNQGNRLIEGVLAPMQKALGIHFIPPISSTELAWQREGTLAWVDEYVPNTTPSLENFPLHRESFKSTYSSIVLVMAIVGLGILMIGSRLDKLNSSKLIVIWSTSGLFILTQQEFLGVNWFAIRFVFALAPLLYILAFFAIEKVCKKFRIENLAFYIGVALITLPTMIGGLEKIRQLQANIKTEEYQFIKKISADNQQELPIFVAAPEVLWIQALAPQWQVFQTHFDAICNDEQAKKRINPQMYEIGEAFSNKVSVEQSLAIFKKFSQNQNYLIYLDTKNYRCINGNLFTAAQYPSITKRDGLVFLKHQ